MKKIRAELEKRASRDNGRSVHWWANKEDRERLEWIADTCQVVEGIRPSSAVIIRLALKRFHQAVTNEVKAKR